MTTTGSWIARDACDRDDCTMRPYQHRHLTDGTPEPAVADCEMSEVIACVTPPGDDRGRELANHEQSEHERGLRSWAAPHAHEDLGTAQSGPIWLMVWAVREIDRLRALAAPSAPDRDALVRAIVLLQEVPTIRVGDSTERRRPALHDEAERVANVALRALAAPAETEAGDWRAVTDTRDVLLDVARETREGENDDLGRDVLAQTFERFAERLTEALAAAPPTPEGEAGGLPGNHEDLISPQRKAARADELAAMARNRRRAEVEARGRPIGAPSTSPPAPGEGQGATEGGEEPVTSAEVIAWHRARFGGDPADVLVMGKLAEEAGEVCGAITKRAEGAVRPAKGLVTREDWSAHLLDEVGDVGIVLHTLCAREGTTLDEVVTRRFRDDVSLRTRQEATAPGEQCPTCASRRPEQHPAVQEGGEVQPCPDPFHATITAENTAERVAALSGDLWTIYPAREGWWTPAPAGPQAEGAGETVTRVEALQLGMDPYDHDLLTSNGRLALPRAVATWAVGVRLNEARLAELRAPSGAGDEAASGGEGG